MTNYDYRQMTSNMLRFYRAAPQEAVEAGGAWYPQALEKCEQLSEQYGISVPHVAVALSHLSPRQKWQANQDLTDYLLAGKERPVWGLTVTWENAQRSLEFDNPLDSFSRRAFKTRDFAKAVLGDKQVVVVDTWMARAAGVPENFIRSILGYNAVADACRRGARRVGLAPRELQAIIWCSVRQGDK